METGFKHGMWYAEFTSVLLRIKPKLQKQTLASQWLNLTHFHFLIEAPSQLCDSPSIHDLVTHPPSIPCISKEPFVSSHVGRRAVQVVEEDALMLTDVDRK